jgi:hypothetical protein
MLLFLGIALVSLLLATLAVGRRPYSADPDTWASRPAWPAWVGGVVLVLAANWPLVLWAAAFAGRGAGDARTHATVAHAIARHGLPHGWTDAYGGGFPVGPHYPWVGWGLSALLIKVGVGPMDAVDAVGCASILAVPLAAFALALRAGARPFAALACALVVSWVSPAGYFVSGYEAFYGQGLLSQVLAIPCLVLLVAGIARSDSPWKATVPAVLAVACHPQVAIAAIGALLLPVLVSRERSVMVRYLRATVAMSLFGAALYGPGIATLKVPFGWPPMEEWKTIGFGVDRLGPWLLEGKLIDVGRAPVLTALWGASLLVSLARFSRPAARAATLASVATVTLSASGRVLQALGSPGAFLLSFFQPMRVLALVPLVAAATVLVAVEEGAPVLRGLCERAVRRLSLRAGSSRVMGALVGTAALGLATWAAFPVRIHVAHLVLDKVRAILDSFGPDSACGPAPPGGTPRRAVKSWVSSLTGGRLWYDDTSETSAECEFSTGFEIDSSVPIAVTSGVGGHVGVHQVAFHQLAPERAGSARRAEALGVRHVLLFSGEPPSGADWRTVHRSGSVLLAERVGGTDLVGVGCMTSVWAGSDDALRERLFADLATRRGARTLLDPEVLVGLDTVGGDWREQSAPPDDCSVVGAVVHEVPREPGAQEADVESPSPVDVVFRVAAFPTWRVRVDGEPARTTTVAPGFPSVRVPAGKHHVEAVVSLLPWYLAGLGLAFAGVVVCSLSSSGLRRARRPGDRAVARARV